MALAWRISAKILILGFIALLAPWSAVAQFSSKPSFGMVTKNVVLKRRLPPIVKQVTGKSIKITVEEKTEVGIQLQSSLENLLTKPDSGVHVDSNSPDFIVDCNITLYQPPVANKSTGLTGGTVITSALTVAFRIIQVRSNSVLTSGVATAQISEDTSVLAIHHDYRKIKTGVDALNDNIAEVGRQIAEYLVVTEEVVQPAVAYNGLLNGPLKLAQSNLWSRDLEALETLPKYSDPKLEAYRIYDIGLANEALAYQSEDLATALKYLQEASTDYGKAIDAKPEEKNFLEPQNRIKSALIHYTEPASPQSLAQNDKGMTNEDVIALVQAKMDNSIIIDDIKSASKVTFDTGYVGQARLAQSGVTSQIIKLMMEKQKQQRK